MPNITMNLKNWCEENNIDYVYILTTETIKNNKKSKKFTALPTPKQGDMFYYINKDNQAANLNNDPREIFKHENREELIKENHKRYCDFNTIAIDTTNCIWFDIDIENQAQYNKINQQGRDFYDSIKKTIPYHKSMTKEYGLHCFCSKMTDTKISKKLLSVLNNHEANSISDITVFKNWMLDKEVTNASAKKLRSEYSFVEIEYDGIPLWADSNSIMNNTTAKNLGKKTGEFLTTILKTDFIETYRDKTAAEQKKIDDDNKRKKKEEDKKIKEQEKLKKQELNMKKLEKVEIDNNYITDNQQLILNLTKLISTKLYLEYTTVFHNIVWSLSYNNCDKSLEFIKETGKKSTKYNKPINYDKYFDKLVKDGKNKYQLSIGVIYNLARQSNLKQYIKLVSKNITSTNNDTIAELFIKSYFDDLVMLRNAPDEEPRLWFYNHEVNIWSDETSCSYKTLTKIIKDFALKYFEELEKDENEPIDCSEEKHSFRKNLEQARAVKDFILGNLIIQPKIIKFNDKTHLIPFKNTVFNTRTCGWEEHRRENYITLVLDYDYYEPDEEEQQKAIDYFESLFLWKEDGIVVEKDSHRDIMNDVKYILASCLVGRDEGEHFYIFNGQGGNGKSKLCDLMNMILNGNSGNKYHTDTNGNLLCAEIDPNKPTPDIANLENKRMCVYQEPSENKYLNISAIKYLTGEKKIKARKLFKNPTDFSMMTTHILVCNIRLAFQGAIQTALIRRIIDIHLPFIFDNNKQNITKKIYKKKQDLNFEDIKMGFIHMLLEYIINFEKRTIIENPEEKDEKKIKYKKIGLYKKNINDIHYDFSDTTMNRTKDYLLEYDYLGQFLRSYISRSGDVGDKISFRDISNDFKNSHWYSDLDDKLKNRFNNFTAFKKGLQEVDEFKDILYEDKQKKGWFFIYANKKPDFDSQSPSPPDPQVLIPEEEENTFVPHPNWDDEDSDNGYDYSSD
jgi:energy-coupling factor transporter ATP-binding protein EcfA2